MINNKKIEEWINIYLEHIEEITPEKHVTEEEGYKFKSVELFQKNFNINTSNLSENIERSIENNNLVAGNMYWPLKMLLIFAKEKEEETRAALIKLFNLSEDVSKRIDDVEKIFDELIAQRNEQLKEEANSFINLRFLSLLLSFRYPEKYNAVKPREWNMFCKYIDSDFKNLQRSSGGERYAKMNLCIDALRKKIKKMPEIKKIRDFLTRGLDFNDEEYRWIAQDIIYVTSRLIAENKSMENNSPKENIYTNINYGIINDNDSVPLEFPLEEYLENFIIRNWENIDFEENLSLYIDDEGTPAQQYPTSEGFIDILAKDENNNYVVIELKKGRSNQQVVGQILGYIGWVKRNLAIEDQKVRGIIIASSGNNALIDAVSTVSNFISIKYYRVKFNFENPIIPNIQNEE